MAATLALNELAGASGTSDFSFATLVEQGLPTDKLAILKQHGLTFTEVSEIVISPRTLKHRKDRAENLSGEETDRLVRVARTLALADRVFGNPAKALNWLRTPPERLGGRTALSMLRTDAGGRLVDNRLWQIDEGIFT